MNYSKKLSFVLGCFTIFIQADFYTPLDEYSKEHGSSRNALSAWLMLNVEYYPHDNHTAPVHTTHLQDVTRALKLGLDLETRDVHGWTPLMFAAFHGYLEMVELFVAHGAIIDAKDYQGYTPLARAALEGHEAVVRFLIAHGAQAYDINLHEIKKKMLDARQQQESARAVCYENSIACIQAAQK